MRDNAWYASLRGIDLMWFVLSVLVSLVLLCLPVWSTWGIASPAWVLMAYLYWRLAYPARFGLLCAWCLGLLLDAVLLAPFGMHALVLVLVAYLIGRSYKQLNDGTLFQQAVMVFGFTLLYQLLLLLIALSLQQAIQLQTLWMQPLFSALLWPLFAFCLRGCQGKRTRARRIL